MRKILLLLLLLLVVSVPVWSQGGRLVTDPVAINAQGQPIGGATIAVCQPLATTAASVSGNLATFTMASNPITAGFVNGMTIQVVGFTGADTYFNAGTLANGTITNGYVILAVSPTTVTVALTHANASATSNGTLLQMGNTATSCAGLVTIYTDTTLTTTQTNPFTSDGLGNYGAGAPAGVYYVQTYGSGITTQLRQITSNIATPSTQVSVPCASSLTLTPSLTFATDFLINLTCNVTSTTVTLPTGYPVGYEVVLGISQSGSFTFAFPANFISNPAVVIPTGAGTFSFSTWQWCGTVGNGAACPANQWINQDQGPAGTLPPGGGGTAVGPLNASIQTISPLAFGGVADAITLGPIDLSGGGSTLVSSGLFTASLVNKVVVCLLPNDNQDGLALTTVTTFTDSSHIVVAGTIVRAFAGQYCTFATQNFRTALLAAQAAVGPNGTLVLPCGSMLLSGGQVLSSFAAASGQLFIQGCPNKGTRFIMDWATMSTRTTAAVVMPTLSGQNVYISNIIFDTIGGVEAGSTFQPSGGSSIGAVVTFTGARVENVAVNGWFASGGSGTQACFTNSQDGSTWRNVSAKGCFIGIHVFNKNVTLIQDGINSNDFNGDTTAISIEGQEDGDNFIGGTYGPMLINANAQASGTTINLFGVNVNTAVNNGTAVTIQAGSTGPLNINWTGGEAITSGNPTNFTGVRIGSNAVLRAVHFRADSKGTGVGINNSGTLWNLGVYALNTGAALLSGSGTFNLNSGSACAPPRCFNIAAYGAVPHYIAYDATWASNGTSVTITASDAPFTSSMTGQSCFGMPGTAAAGPSAMGSFTFSTSTTGTCSPAGSLVGAPSAAGAIVVGTDATTAIANATTALFAQPGCGTLYIPAGHFIVTHGFGANPPAQCTVVSPPGTIGSGIQVKGEGYPSSFLTPGPGFTTTGCSGNNGCFWSNVNTTYQDFTIDGLGQNLTGVNMPNYYFSLAANSLAINVDLFNWGTSPNSGGIGGALISGLGAYGLGLSVQNFGPGSANIVCGAGDVQCLLNNSAANSTLKILSGSEQWDSEGNYTGVWNNGGTFHGDGTRTAAAGSGTSFTADTNSTTYLHSAKIGFGSQGAGTSGISLGNGAVVYLTDTTVNGGSTGGVFNAGGGVTADVWDLGGNTYTGGPLAVGAGTIRFHNLNVGIGLAGTYRVTTDQTITAGASLTAIPGLSWTLPANIATNVNFSCHLTYSQATAVASDSFGIQDVTVAPTNVEADAMIGLNNTGNVNTPNITGLNTTTATAFTAFTPALSATVFTAFINGTIEQPSNASSSVFQIMAQFTTNNGTIKRGSACQVF